MIEGIEKELKQIVAVAEGLPVEYREKCFEILLQYALNVKVPYPEVGIREKAAGQEKRTRPLALKEIANQFKASGRVDNAILSAYWLEEYRGKTDGYQSSEIVDCFRTLRLNYKNPRDPISKAKKDGYLMDHDGKLLLTQTGLDYARSKFKKEEDE